MTAISYGLILALVALVILGALANVGTGLQRTFCHVAVALAPTSTLNCLEIH